MKLGVSLICLSFSIFSYAQLSQVKPDEAAQAEALKKKYPKEDEVAIFQEETYTFDFNRSEKRQPVVATEKVNTSLISLKDNNHFSKAIFYDSESNVKSIAGFNHKNRPFQIFSTTRKYQSNEIFYDDAMLSIFGIDFETRGEKSRYVFEKEYYDVKYLTSIYFHDQFPILEKTINVIVPDWLTLDLKEFNFEGYNIIKKVTPLASKKQTTYTFTVKDLNARKSEKGAPHPAKSFPHLVLVCKSYNNGGKSGTLFETTADLYKWYHSLVEKIGNDPKELQGVVKRLTENKKTDIEKIESIYYWVQENIRYIAFENGIMGFKPESAQNVFKNKYGDCKGKANLLKEMLKIAGFDARLTWIGTSDLPYDYTLPSLCVDNHMICTLILDKKRYFLDGTEDFISFNDYAHRIQGKQVLIEDGSNFIVDTIPSYTNKRNKVEKKVSVSLDGDVLKGRSDYVYNGEEKTNILRGYASVRSDNKDEALRRFLSDNNKNLRISDIKTSDLNNRQAPLSLSYNFELANHITKAGNEVYVSLDSDKEFASFDFDSTRTNDYEFNNKMLLETKMDFVVPAGFKVDYMPEAVKTKYGDFSFNLEYVKSGNNITYTKKITIDNAIIHRKDFKLWNKCVKQLAKFYNDQIVLVKN